MRPIIERPAVGRIGDDLVGLREILALEKQRIESLLDQIDVVLTRVENRSKHPRPSPLDRIKAVATATKDLRLSNGRLSAVKVAALFGVSLSELSTWLGRSKQALSKTPDAESLQDSLGFFERIARLRLVGATDAEFRKWLRTPDDTLSNRSPLDLVKAGLWQEMADKVNDMLTGAPT